ncbi:NAD-dependent deacetylase sir2D-like isoform X2 [Macrobrachium nipponense]|uniref:NAD-dependent deacetylase sir2D-like isoform X2 n=1 Tax=Macrobrachium nipponense TaxID=159736 RepID=UPI0030C83713
MVVTSSVLQELRSCYQEATVMVVISQLLQIPDLMNLLHLKAWGSYSNGGDFTITSDSGFNELTPPQSMEDEITTPTSSSQGGNIDRPETENDFADENTNDSSVNDCPDNWQNVTSVNQDDDDDDDDDRQSVASTASNLSGLSDFSNFSGKDWKPCAGPMSWVQQQMLRGVDPRSVLAHMLGSKARIPEGMSDVILWRFILNMLMFSEPPRREKLRHINTLEDVVRLLKSCRKIIVLTGAGVSVSCGIPDFRSRDGIYARLAVDFPDLPNPEAMFDIHHFRRDPRPFFTFAREIYPGQFTPSLCHKFIHLLERNNKLLRNYTQNIDTLEQVAGIKNVIQCHGSFATATCQQCGHKVDANAIKEDIFSQRIPQCPICTEEQNEQDDSTSSLDSQQRLPSESNSSSQENRTDKHQKSPDNATTSQDDDIPELDILSSHRLPEPCQVPLQPIMKPDIVFFGEGLPDEFHDRMAEDKDECDLLIVIGSSLKVRPVALIPSSVPSHVPQILINREPLRHLTFDVELLGDCDVIINELCHRMGNGWKDLCIQDSMTEIRELPPRPLPPLSINSADGDDTNSSVGTPLIAPQHAPHPRDESDIEALRACWAPKIRETVASRLPDNMFLYTGGHKYVFPGAEVYYDPDDDFEEDDEKCRSSESENEDDITQEEDSQSGHDQASAASSTHHPRLEDCHSTDAPHLSPEDVDSLLSAADNGQNQDHEDWTSLNASLDTSLDCDHTLPGCDTDNEQTSDNASKVTDFSSNRYSPPSDL